MDATPRPLWPSLLLPALPVLGVGISGALQIAVGLRLPLGLALAGAGILLTAAAVFRFGRPGLGRPSLLGAVATFLALAAALVFFTLYSRPFDGLVSVGGGDAGQHVGLRTRLIEGDTDAYYGFVAFHTLTRWLEVAFGLDAFESFRVAFYLVPLGVAAAAAAAFARVQEEPPGSALWARWAVLVASLGACFVFVVLPLLHYHQADGFFPHLFALLPLFTAWVLQAAARSVWVRVLTLLLLPVYLRFCYGLNLGDAFVASAAGVLLEAGALGGRLRRAGFALGALLGLVALAAYGRLLPLAASMPGNVLAHYLVPVGAAQAALGAGLVLFPRAARRWGLDVGDAAARLARFAGTFGLLGGVVPLAFVALALPRLYYVYKYSLLGVVLVLVGWGVLLSVSLPVGRPARAWRPWAALALLGLSSTIAIARGFPEPWRGFVERVRGGPFRRLGPLADRDGWQRMEQALKERKARFGGLLASSWPLAIFTSASFGYWEDWPQYAQSRLEEGPGRCWFWYAQPDAFSGFGAQVPPTLASRVAQLEADPTHRCEEYPARWDPSARLRLCHLCR